MERGSGAAGGDIAGGVSAGVREVHGMVSRGVEHALSKTREIRSPGVCCSSGRVCRGGEGLPHFAGFLPPFFIVVFAQVADDDTPGGAGVSEVAVFEVYADVVQAAFLFGEAEEDEVSGFHAPLAYALAVFVVDGNDGSLQGFVVYFFVDGLHEPGAVGARVCPAPVAVGGSQPEADFLEKGEGVALVDGESQFA